MHRTFQYNFFATRSSGPRTISKSVLKIRLRGCIDHIFKEYMGKLSARGEQDTGVYGVQCHPSYSSITSDTKEQSAGGGQALDNQVCGNEVTTVVIYKDSRAIWFLWPNKEIQGKRQSYKQIIKTGSENQKTSKTTMKEFPIWCYRAHVGKEPLTGHISLGKPLTTQQVIDYIQPLPSWRVQCFVLIRNVPISGMGLPSLNLGLLIVPPFVDLAMDLIMEEHPTSL